MIRYTLKIDVTGERELYSNIVFTAGDARGYRLDFSFYNGKEKISTEGCALSVKAKRADGAVVIDSGVIRGEECYWVAADNAYSVGGSLELEVALSKTDGTFVTICVIFASVREGFGEKGLASSNNEPILAKLSAQSLLAQAAVSAHKTDAGAHAELFEKERATFNSLYAPALIDETESDTELVVADAVKDTPLALSIYGACTETLPAGVTEKSIENPATIAGVGESGSVTVMVTDGESGETTIEIPLDAPLYGIRHPETGEWLARDEIRVEDGKVKLVQNIVKLKITSDMRHISAGTMGQSDTEIRLAPTNENGALSAYGTTGGYNVARCAVCSLQLMTGIDAYGYPADIALGYAGGYIGHILCKISNDVLGVTSSSTEGERVAAFKNWVTNYNVGSDVPFTMYFKTGHPKTIDITDTDAGKLLLALSANGNMTVKTNENSPVGMRYHRNIKSAYEELKNAMIAMGGTI
ncbi:MAG: hypothetical protein IJA08_04095 [Clostridia bacterium]|nr:hypothetical protein [Clostridia bacterium]